MNLPNLFKTGANNCKSIFAEIFIQKQIFFAHMLQTLNFTLADGIKLVSLIIGIHTQINLRLMESNYRA